MSKVHQQNVVELVPITTSTATLTGSAIDVTDYDGVAHVILQSAAGTGTTPTLDVKITEATTSGGTYADVTGATFAQLTDAANVTEMITIDTSASMGFIKVVGTITGTTPSYDWGVSMVANKSQGRNSSQVV